MIVAAVNAAVAGMRGASRPLFVTLFPLAQLFGQSRGRRVERGTGR